jgi:hypothetical protein
MNWKGYGRKLLWPVSMKAYYHGSSLEGLSETTRNVSKDSRSPGRDVNPGSPEY